METQAQSDDFFGDYRDDVVVRCKSKSIAYKAVVLPAYSDTDAPRRSLSIILSNGRSNREILVPKSAAESLLSAKFENWTILGDYVAYLDRSEGRIEAMVRAPGRMLMSSRVLLSLPGIVKSRKSSESDPDGEEVVDELSDLDDIDWHWTVMAGSNSLELSLSLAGLELALLSGVYADYRRNRNGTRISIRGLSTDRHDDALQILEKYCSALFFEMDLRYSVPLTLVRQRPPTSEIRAARLKRGTSAPIDKLVNSYSEQPVAMYFYGRSATGMPLLQFLAYYQAIEFFFPSFANADALTRVRNLLRDPLFNREDQGDIQKIASVVQGSFRGGSTESEQLRTTLHACVQDFEIKEFLSAGSARKEFFTSSSPLKEVGKINLDSGNKVRLIDQFSDRIYTLRCRIVHAKETGGPKEQELLLPFGAEADSLRHDVALLQFLAQKVIIAGSRGSL